MSNLDGNFMIGGVRTSSTEIRELGKAWLAISLAFGIMLGGLSNLGSTFILAAFTVGSGFLLHEIAHKLVAQHFNCWAEFRSFDQMLILAVIMSFFGVVFAAPGAVMIQGEVTNRRNGLISIAGPITNIILSLGFLIGLLMGIVPLLMLYGFKINVLLALFNMLPFGNFDGAKILNWNKTAFGVVIGAGVCLLLIQLYLRL